MKGTGWSTCLDVTVGGEGIVSHAGLVLLRQLADQTGLTGGLSKALTSPRLLVHDRGQVVADLGVAIAGGAEVISDFAVLGAQRDLYGLVASVPTAWRTLDEIAVAGPRALSGSPRRSTPPGAGRGRASKPATALSPAFGSPTGSWRV